MLRLGDVDLPLGGTTHLMAVLNVSPDSKNTHTVARGLDEALTMAERYRAWGAGIIDVGGQSSHYDNPTVAEAEEAARVTPVIAALAREGHLVSIDTWKPAVASAAVEVGAVMVNDTGGLSDPGMRAVVAAAGVPVVAVYVEGEHPHDVGEFSPTEDKAADIVGSFESLLADLEGEGIDQVILDPGVALNYRGDYDTYTRLQLDVIARSGSLHTLGRPVLIPIPRKRDFHRVAAYIALALEHGADLIRVHDVPLAADLRRLFRRAP
jgi:dihydropteroate synthase